MRPRMLPTETGENGGKRWDVSELVGPAASAVDALTFATFLPKNR